MVCANYLGGIIPAAPPQAGCPGLAGNNLGSGTHAEAMKTFPTGDPVFPPGAAVGGS